MLQGKDKRNMKQKKALESKFKKGMSAQEIVEVCGMSGRPEHYSGKGATIYYLNSEILEKIYTGVRTVHGINAGEEFVQMIIDIPKMSATDFLYNLYNLESNNWNWDKRMTREESGVYINNKDYLSKFFSGIMTAMGGIYGMHAQDETLYIRGQFLANHGVK